MEKATVTMREDQKAWLNNHPEINLSGLVQKSIDEIMHSGKKVE
jgi:hypothetical protein